MNPKKKSGKTFFFSFKSIGPDPTLKYQIYWLIVCLYFYDLGLAGFVSVLSGSVDKAVIYITDQLFTLSMS